MIISNKTQYKGTLNCAPSKSYMQRASALALLANGKTILKNACYCNDTLSILKVVEQLGASVSKINDEVHISPRQEITQNNLHMGESGLGIRMMAPVAALRNEKIELNGNGTLATRPMHLIADALHQLDVSVELNDGKLPISLTGPIKGGDIQIDGSLSSQLLTGLLIALPKAQQNSTIQVANLKSIPYIDMTLDIVSKFGGQIKHNNYQSFQISGNQQYKGIEYTIEGDWSGAAFHLVAGALTGEITLNHLQPHSKQADVAILNALAKAGAHIYTTENSVTVKKGALNAFQFDATHCPDLFPPLANLAAQCNGTSVIKGVTRLKHKESDRATAIQNEWAQLGIQVKLEEDNMIIHGGVIEGGKIHSHHDHRMAMMGAIAALTATSPIEIEASEAVAKSYPNFYQDYNYLTTTRL